VPQSTRSAARTPARADLVLSCGHLDDSPSDAARRPPGGLSRAWAAAAGTCGACTDALRRSAGTRILAGGVELTTSAEGSGRGLVHLLCSATRRAVFRVDAVRLGESRYEVWITACEFHGGDAGLGGGPRCRRVTAAGPVAAIAEGLAGWEGEHRGLAAATGLGAPILYHQNRWLEALHAYLRSGV
jgi:hypothetical protein